MKIIKMTDSKENSTQTEINEIESSSLTETSLVTIDATTEINKMPGIQARVSAWIYMQETDKINEILRELHMIIRDDNFENQKRLQDNLVHNYNPKDFELEPEKEENDIDNVRQIRLKSKATSIASESLNKSFERTKHEMELDKLKDKEWEAIDKARRQIIEAKEAIVNREKALQQAESVNMTSRYNEIIGRGPTSRRSVTFTEFDQNINGNQIQTASSSLQRTENMIIRNQTMPSSHSQMSGSFYSRPKDIGETIRKWNIRFSADGTKSIRKFLEEIDRRASLLSVTSDELLLALPDMLEGKAKIWHSAMYK